jgi:hypothetical protein
VSSVEPVLPGSNEITRQIESLWIRFLVFSTRRSRMTHASLRELIVTSAALARSVTPGLRWTVSWK